MPFYFLGLSISWQSIVELRVSSKKYASIIFLALAAAIVACVKFLLKIDVKPGDFDSYGDVFPSLAICASFYILSCSCIFFLIAFAPGRNIKIFTKIGTNCMAVYVLNLYIVSLFATKILYPFLLSINANDYFILASQCGLLFMAGYLLSFNFIMKAIMNGANFIESIVFLKRKGKLYHCDPEPKLSDILFEAKKYIVVRNF